MLPTPIRTDEDIIGARVSMTLGGQAYHLPVLSMAANREWTRLFANEVRTKLAEVGPLTTADEVATEVAKSSETMMDLLISYDAAGAASRGTEPVLPPREWIDTHATDTECYVAMKLVTVAAFPPAPDLMQIVPEFMPMILQSISKGVAAATVSIALERSMSSSARSTASARRKRSKPASPTSSSSSTPRKPRSAASAKPKSSKTASPSA